MQLRKIMLVFLGISIPCSVKAYVYGYKKLYKKHTRTTIDLIYDTHVPIPQIGVEQFLKLDSQTALATLYPTEQKILRTIRRWEANRCGYDLIWETPSVSNYHWTPDTPCFIALPLFFHLLDMKYVRFISADRYRNCGFNTLFSLNNGAYQATNLTGCSFDNPAPLSARSSFMIERISGTHVLRAYNALHARVVSNLRNYFGKFYYQKMPVDFLKDFHQNDVFHELCDIEMLAHILSSTAERIVVYAGGWHCTNIAAFLEKNGWGEVYHQKNYCFHELPVLALAPLEPDKNFEVPFFNNG